MDVDFTLWAAGKKEDVMLTNGTLEVPCHKKILSALSSVFKDMLDGDENASEIVVTDIGDKYLEVIYNVLYDSPSESDLNKLKNK